MPHQLEVRRRPTTSNSVVPFLPAADLAGVVPSETVPTAPAMGTVKRISEAVVRGERKPQAGVIADGLQRHEHREREVILGVRLSTDPADVAGVLAFVLHEEPARPFISRGLAEQGRVEPQGHADPIVVAHQHLNLDCQFGLFPAGRSRRPRAVCKTIARRPVAAAELVLQLVEIDEILVLEVEHRLEIALFIGQVVIAGWDSSMRRTHQRAGRRRGRRFGGCRRPQRIAPCCFVAASEHQSSRQLIASEATQVAPKGRRSPNPAAKRLVASHKMAGGIGGPNLP